MNEHIPPEDLSAYLDHDLAARRRRRVDAHLETCAACRAELASLQWTVDFVRAAPVEVVPPAAAFHIAAEAESEAETDDFAPPAARALEVTSWRPSRGWLAVGALGAIAAVLAVAVGAGRWRQPAAPQSSSAPEASMSLDPDAARGESGVSDDARAISESGDASEIGGTRLPAEIDGTAAARAIGKIVRDAGRPDDDPRALATAFARDRARRIVMIATAAPAADNAMTSTQGAPLPLPVPSRTPPVAAAPAPSERDEDRGGYTPPDAPIPGLARRSALGSTIVVTPTLIADPSSAAAGAAGSTAVPAAAAESADSAVSATPDLAASPEPAAAIAMVDAPPEAPAHESAPPAAGGPSSLPVAPLAALAVALFALCIVLVRKASRHARRWR